LKTHIGFIFKDGNVQEECQRTNALIKRDGVNIDWLNNEVKRAIGAD